MNQTYTIKTASVSDNAPKVLLIYTGGTLGMVYDKKTKSLVPFDFGKLLEIVPEIHRLDFKIDLVLTDKPIDSATINPQHWVQLASLIEDNYYQYDSFVVIHGTDTMAYSASALSFMLENLEKPVIFTGAQLPIGAARTDAKENLITALEIAADRKSNGEPMVAEVCVYFSSYLLRGNRSKKQESYQFYAFRSENYPHLAEAGVSIDYNLPFLMPYLPDAPLVVHKKLDTHVAVLKLFPGINEAVVNGILSINNLKGIVIETFGAGNAPTDEWFIDALKCAIDKGVIILNVSQCDGGRVSQGKYQSSLSLQEIGVLSGNDMTFEAAITKMMYVLGRYNNLEEQKKQLILPIVGEMR
jgi:L-asparaginase